MERESRLPTLEEANDRLRQLASILHLPKIEMSCGGGGITRKELSHIVMTIPGAMAQGTMEQLEEALRACIGQTPTTPPWKMVRDELERRGLLVVRPPENQRTT